MDVVATLVSQGNIRRKQLIGLGIGLAGVVDARAGMLRKSPYLPWHDLPLRDLLQSKLRLPVYLDNDVNTLTLAEKWFGAGQGVENFLVVTVGRGVGLGIVMNGQFCRGAHGGAGEFGHTLVDVHGPLCACGKRGCLEAYASDPALMREAAVEGAVGRRVTTPNELVVLSAEGDHGARAILSRAGEVLGRAVADLINLLDPELIILGGEGTRSGEALFGPMRQALGQQVMSGLSNDIQIRVEPWGDDAWARGAASLVLRELFESPVHKEENQSAVPAR
jgi:predicted NBD/HSP70 family sugar kinase